MTSGMARRAVFPIIRLANTSAPEITRQVSVRQAASSSGWIDSQVSELATPP